MAQMTRAVSKLYLMETTSMDRQGRMLQMLLHGAFSSLLQLFMTVNIVWDVSLHDDRFPSPHP